MLGPRTNVRGKREFQFVRPSSICLAKVTRQSNSRHRAERSGTRVPLSTPYKNSLETEGQVLYLLGQDTTESEVRKVRGASKGQSHFGPTPLDSSTDEGGQGGVGSV